MSKSPFGVSTEQVHFEFKYPATYGWIEAKLPRSLVNHIWSCINDAHGNVKPSLVGHIDKSLAIKDKNDILWKQLLSQLVDAYGRKWDHNHYKVPIKNEADKWKLYLDQMWVNYQNQHEFNPLHNHGGVYSFAAWLKIPTDHQEQQEIYNAKDANGGLNSAFCFHYTDSLGNIRTTIYPQRPDMEGTMLFFPSKLNHEVYPYYECDEQRISISGNLWLRE